MRNVRTSACYFGSHLSYGRPSWNSLGALLMLFLLAGCGAMNVGLCKGQEQPAVQELLYFGTETPSGHVTPEAWAQFLNEMVAPRFPQGFSAWQASGQWRLASGTVIREPSYVLSLVHPDDAGQGQAVQEIIVSYKMRFQQEGVLRARSPICMSL